MRSDGFKISDTELLSIFGATASNSDAFYNAITSDSRKVKPGDIFLARRGEQTDGHNYIDKAIEAGARAVISEKVVTADGVDCIQVEDSDQALGMLAKYWRQKLAAPVFVITGSNGKTTTKEFLVSALKRLKGSGSYSKASHNNHTGLPFSILDAPEDTNWLVLEAGMNHPGELTYLGGIAQPDFGVITNVGAAHLGHFSDISEIAKAKSELLFEVKASGKSLIFADGCDFSGLLDGLSSQLFSYGRADADYRFVDNGKVTLNTPDGKVIEADVPVPGEHNRQNAAACLALLHMAYGEVPGKDIFYDYRPPKHRFNIIKLPTGQTIVDDCYNSNPDSAIAGLNTLSSIHDGAPLLVVFGDMNELGELSESEHKRLGQQISSIENAALLAVGNYANFVVESADLIDKQSCTNVDEAISLDSEYYKSYSWIYLKGSRGVELDKLVNHLKNL